MSPPNPAANLDDRQLGSILGSLLGTACGDALGLPYEGRSPQVIARSVGSAPIEHAWLVGRGMLSDDTEQSALLAQVLCTQREPAQVAQRLGRKLRWWFLALPPGMGLGTARACIRLLLRVPVTRSGANSAGNGAAMRAAILGVVANDDEHASQLAIACSRVTHRDARAVDGARVVARWAHALSRDSTFAVPDRIDALIEDIGDPTMRDACRRAAQCARDGDDIDVYRTTLECRRGPSGFIVQTLPAVIYCVLAHPDDSRAAVETAIRLGGDTDTIAAIVGGLMGAAHGSARWPTSWVEGIVDWPWNAASLTRLAHHLANQTAPPTLFPLWPRALLRNMVLLVIAIAHVGRRWVRG